VYSVQSLVANEKKNNAVSSRHLKKRKHFSSPCHRPLLSNFALSTALQYQPRSPLPLGGQQLPRLAPDHSCCPAGLNTNATCWQDAEPSREGTPAGGSYSLAGRLLNANGRHLKQHLQEHRSVSHQSHQPCRYARVAAGTTPPVGHVTANTGTPLHTPHHQLQSHESTP
jgi:hypothetical protein